MRGLGGAPPADAIETVVGGGAIRDNPERQPGLCLTRQNVPTFDRTPGRDGALASAEGTARGGYILADASGGLPEVILIGTGSEVQLAVGAPPPPGGGRGPPPPGSLARPPRVRG